MQGTEIYSDKYKLCGKIDIFNTSTGVLTERKKEIKTIYDGYIFQVYAQYFALTEMGYKVTSIVIYCLTHNKSHVMYLPHENEEMLQKFERLIKNMNKFKINDPEFMPNEAKCDRCIYPTFATIAYVKFTRFQAKTGSALLCGRGTKTIIQE